MIPFLETIFDLDSYAKILTVFVIANSILSIAITYTMQRQSLIRWRLRVYLALVLLWVAILLSFSEILFFEMPFQIVIDQENTLYNPLLKSASIIWIIGISLLLIVLWRIFSLDFIKFGKSNLSREFHQNKPKLWGTKSLNDIMAQHSDKIYFPIIINANEHIRPWRLLQRFFLSGLTYNQPYTPGGIYFTFTRPAHEIYSMLKRRYEELVTENQSQPGIIGDIKLDWKNVVIVDCYTKKTEKYEKTKNNEKIKESKMKILYADSNNPHNLNKNYEKALKRLKKKNVKNVRVVYDAISDFLKFTDEKLATQYLRHNMGFEQRENIESLYLFKMGTLKKEDEDYFLWFANGVLKLKRKTEGKDEDDYIQAEFRGPFAHARRFKLDFDYKIKN